MVQSAQRKKLFTGWETCRIRTVLNVYICMSWKSEGVREDLFEVYKWMKDASIQVMSIRFWLEGDIAGRGIVSLSSIHFQPRQTEKRYNQPFLIFLSSLFLTGLPPYIFPFISLFFLFALYTLPFLSPSLLSGKRNTLGSGVVWARTTDTFKKWSHS